MPIFMPKQGCGMIIPSNVCVNPDVPWFAQQVLGGGEVKYLLLQRGWGAPTSPGHWGGPGGLRDPEEYPEETAIRETFEETGGGIVIKSSALLFEGQLDDRRLTYFVATSYEVSAEPIQLRKTDGVLESIGMGWFTRKQALRLDLSFLWSEAISLLP